MTKPLCAHPSLSIFPVVRHFDTSELHYTTLGGIEVVNLSIKFQEEVIAETNTAPIKSTE